MSTGATYVFTPTDVLVFGDGRPFSRGDHVMTGPFPPPVSTLYGALRSALIAAADGSFSRGDEGFGLGADDAGVVGTTAEIGTLTLEGAGLCLEAHGGAPVRMYPPPLDLLTKKDPAMEGPERVLLRPMEDEASPGTDLPSWLCPLLPPPHPASTFYTATSGFLSAGGMASVLRGEAPSGSDIAAADAVFTRDPRTSVSLRGSPDTPFTKTARDGMLFTVDFVQVREGVGVVVELDGLGDLRLPDRGVLRLGGEGRPVLYRRTHVAEPAAAEARRLVRSDGRVRMVLTTPTPFSAGWRPDGIGPDGRGRLGGVSVRLTAAAVGRPVTVGGWDIARRRPRPARPATPAGSVYFFVMDRPAEADTLFDAIDGRSLARGDDASLGYGSVRLGHWLPHTHHV